MDRLKKALGAGMVVPVLAIAGCSSGSDKSGNESVQEPTISSFPRVENPKTLSFPLDKYRLLTDNENRRTVGSALKTLRTDCMGRFGFEFHDAEPAAPVEFNHERLYGVADRRTARIYGYHNPRGGVAQSKAQSNLTASAEAVLVGEVKAYKGAAVPEGGCAGYAVRKVHAGGPGMTSADSQLPDRLIAEASLRTQKDSRVSRVFERWSECMKDSGYRYDSPTAVLRDARFAQSAQPTQEEIGTAAADVECKSKNNVIGVWSTVEAAYQRRLVEDNQLALKKIENDISMQVKNAYKVVGRVG
ncbi:hypothetical protein ACIQ6K_00710 [Streptomyces sp. NPDC096354]|uniref:hypothetical protein n=1 Tax=Streptomyces sp. NPDC096354 TaxID=3366088 RepID=UPI0038083715